MVYKLVHVNSRACIKLSNEFSKVTLPGRKTAYRFYSAEKVALCDFMTKSQEEEPRGKIPIHRSCCLLWFTVIMYCSRPEDSVPTPNGRTQKDVRSSNRG